MSLRWYVRRLGAMEPAEVARRARDEAVKRQWRRRWVSQEAEDRLDVGGLDPRFTTPLPASAAALVPPEARRRLLVAADDLLAGHWPVFSSCRDDMMPAPDWFYDPTSGRHAPEKSYCFDIDIRRGSSQRSLKHLWELSRHQHCTVLAAAYHLTGDQRYATAAASQLRSWWEANPFLSGVHWTSGVELGIRLLSWVWVRRLLDDWPAVGSLFEMNPVFLRQLHHHQEYLAALPSYGTSANNHLLAEAAGQFAASCAFPYFEESRRWRASACSILEREVVRQTFPSGLNRELASAYHAFVFELCLGAALEGEASGHPLSTGVWDVLRRMVDAVAAVLDAQLRPPRQGDDDEGHGVLLDPPGFQRWASVLATGEALFGRADWWPPVPRDDVRTPLWTALKSQRPLTTAHSRHRRPCLTDAGMVVLRAESGPDGEDELWCRLDHGPHGYLAIAAHAHADALAIEVRAGGVEILADPGTYCYHGEPEWRAYFRSTLGHNTLEVDGLDQSVYHGSFLWSRHARARLECLSGLEHGPVAEWRAAHDGYRRLRPPATHRRTVRLHRPERVLEIIDRLDTTGTYQCRLAFHLGPDVNCALDGRQATLTWGVNGTRRVAGLALPGQLEWRSIRGTERPPLGWYSPRFGVRLPAVTLLGTGALGADDVLVTTLRFLPATRQTVAREGVQG